jgi:hypothetical protein
MGRGLVCASNIQAFDLVCDSGGDSQDFVSDSTTKRCLWRVIWTRGACRIYNAVSRVLGSRD